jgi:hypothetical protein
VAPAEGDRAQDVLTDLGRQLAERVPAAVPGWARAAVSGVLGAWRAAGSPGGGKGVADEVLLARAEEAGRHAASAVQAELLALARLDVDAQRSTPLEIVRRTVVAGPTALLAEAGVPGVVRDRFAEEHFPDDLYGITPGSLAALDPGLAELALAWGAAKAAAHRARHGGSSPAP